MEPGTKYPRRQVIAPIRRPDRLALEWWIVLLLVSGLVVASVARDFTDRFDLLLYDFAQRQLPHVPSQGIMLVAIDDRDGEAVAMGLSHDFGDFGVDGGTGGEGLR